ncbi:MAG: FG-GAP-like repeat-containing protein [Tunicatimonas sp.]
MLRLLQQVQTTVAHPNNFYANATRIRHFDSLLRNDPDNASYRYQRALDLLRSGSSLAAAEELEDLLEARDAGQLDGRLTKDERASLDSYLALSYLRQGEQENCIINHSAASCLFPIQPSGFHQQPQGSQQAIARYTEILRRDPNDLSARWLLNIAYMTLGQYSDQVPPAWLIPDSSFRSDFPAKHFPDRANAIGFDFRGLSGGLVVDDFTNDGYLDIMISEWAQDRSIRLFINQANGSFTETSHQANLDSLFGGLNLLPADYNNDGWLDVLVLRGAWLQEYGHHPNSLLRNNGNGPDGYPTFTDVTQAAGLLSFHPTQTATWNDFNGDGWLDLFIGNETAGAQSFHYCELYLNNGDGPDGHPTFREVAKEAAVTVSTIGSRVAPVFVKGVTSGDYNNDGWPDLYLSTGGGNNITPNVLFRNNGPNAEGIPTFTNVTQDAGLAQANSTFTTWFWDYDNDGWLDIFAANYWKGGEPSITGAMAAEALGLPHHAATGQLYRNQGDGLNGHLPDGHSPDGYPAFVDVSDTTHLNRILYSMGANFGDLDNDGWLDMYLGTGDPTLSSLVPNRMFRNAEGRYFQDVTTSTGTGHLQKGHAVSFSDLDNDGDQDLLMSMGGAYQGDVFQNAFFENPYQDDHHWVTIRLVGTASNRSAIGTRVVFTVEEQGQLRKIYRDVGSGGSFGASTLRLEVGLGNADRLKEVAIQWQASEIQHFKDLAMDTFYEITEGREEARPVSLNRLHFTAPTSSHQHHASLSP